MSVHHGRSCAVTPKRSPLPHAATLTVLDKIRDSLANSCRNPRRFFSLLSVTHLESVDSMVMKGQRTLRTCTSRRCARKGSSSVTQTVVPYREIVNLCVPTCHASRIESSAEDDTKKALDGDGGHGVCGEAGVQQRACEQSLPRRGSDRNPSPCRVAKRRAMFVLLGWTAYRRSPALFPPPSRRTARAGWGGDGGIRARDRAGDLVLQPGMAPPEADPGRGGVPEDQP